MADRRTESGAGGGPRPNRTAWVALGALGLFWPASVATLLAYTLLGGSWPTSDVFYYVNPVNLDVSPSAATAAVQDGAAVWSTQSDASVQLVYGGPTTVDTVAFDDQNTVFFRNASSGAAIATAYVWTIGDEIVDADVVFWDGSRTFFTGTTGCAGGAYIEDIAAHELGHVLGLGHSAFPDATMYARYLTCSQAMRSLSPDDVSGIEVLYPPAGTPTPPLAPTNLTAVPNSLQPDTAVDLTWVDTSSDEDQFIIERSNDSATFQFVGQTPADVTTYTDGSLTGGSTYWYRVSASNTGGTSGYSNVAIVETSPSPDPEGEPPAAPSYLSPANGSNAGQRPILSWVPSAAATSYDVYLSKTNPPNLYRTGFAGTSLTLPKLHRDRTYYWRIVATNEHGSTPGEVWSFSTSPPGGEPPPAPDPGLTPPANPSPADGETGVDRRPTLSWSPSAEATSYDVYLGKTNPPKLYREGLTTASTKLPLLHRQSLYYWRVVARNNTGSAPSAVWGFTTGTD